MRVLFLTQTNELGPSSRYRVYQLVPWLQKLGLDCEVSPAIAGELYRDLYLETGARRSIWSGFQTIWRKRQADLRRLRQFDVVAVQKGVLPGLYAGFERRIARQKPFVLDFDDAIWLPKEGGSPMLGLLHRKGEAQDLFRHAAAVLAGNEFLATYARRFNPNVTVAPSTVDVARYSSPTASPNPQPAIRNPQSAIPLIGWIGSRTTLPYLKPLRPVFEQLGVIPRVIASGDPKTFGFSVEFHPWQLETEVQELQRLGIGVAPLPDTPWEQGKCGIKLLQYMACGLPAVASAVGVHRDIIRHGENGFLARTLSEWRELLRQLLNDPALRARLGAAARRTVEDRYDIPIAAQKMATVLKAVTGPSWNLTKIETKTGTKISLKRRFP